MFFVPTLRQVFRGWVDAVFTWRVPFMELGDRDVRCRLCREVFSSGRCEVFCTRCELFALEGQHCGALSHTVINGECPACSSDAGSDVVMVDWDLNANLDDDLHLA